MGGKGASMRQFTPSFIPHKGRFFCQTAINAGLLPTPLPLKASPRHARAGGHPGCCAVLFAELLDSRFRGNDAASFHSVKTYP
jgi:hypothetical protein